jgi:epoxyqueuosine reductase
MMEPVVPAVGTNLSTIIRTEARQLGFDLVGIAPAVTPTGIHEFLEWLERGYAGQMTYLERRESAYAHPRNVLDGVRSVVMLGINYNTLEANAEQKVRKRRDEATRPTDGTVDKTAAATAAAAVMPGRIARYALGLADYHGVIRAKLRRLADFVQCQEPDCKVRGIVDTAPLLERDFARAAGLGWFGKNTMLINKHLGSWFFLAAMLIDVELDYDTPHAASHCGTCTRCLDACPTGAITAPYELDARRCISYLTIEHRGPIEPELQYQMGDWLYGCDICQDVCPHNGKAPAAVEPALQPRFPTGTLDVSDVIEWSEEQYRARLRGTAMKRVKLPVLKRNAGIVARNLLLSHEQ